ncbi:hypothetical protein [Paraflavitalea pollutisoli]|uniref:hypothetical protein n=1 Tax=Paraflavitalea pollutisoli TaxID=3034143 RepID=UPI0023EB17CE|nr:hypothetical protein [Paraflavitalea sp. H1-2-19X]
MNIEEYEQQERQEKAQRKKKILSWVVILVPILTVATCNFYINTHQENAIIENPEPGDYFVFRGLIGDGDQPFKLKAIDNDSMEFYVPKYELMNFKFGKSESKVYEMEKKGELYEEGLTMKLARAKVDRLRKNSEISERMGHNGRDVYLKTVFGRSRGNAVESALEKVAGKEGEKAK